MTLPTLENVVFENVNINNVNFGNVDLSGTDFSGVDVTGADFSTSDISDAIFTNIINPEKAKWLVGFNYIEAQATEGPIDMPTFLEKVKGYPESSNVSTGQKGVIDLVEFNLQDVSAAFVGVSLEGIDLSGQNLTGFDISQANLSNCNLSYSNCTGLKFSETKHRIY